MTLIYRVLLNVCDILFLVYSTRCQEFRMSWNNNNHLQVSLVTEFNQHKEFDLLMINKKIFKRSHILFRIELNLV